MRVTKVEASLMREWISSRTSTIKRMIYLWEDLQGEDFVKKGIEGWKEELEILKNLEKKLPTWKRK